MTSGRERPWRAVGGGAHGGVRRLFIHFYFIYFYFFCLHDDTRIRRVNEASPRLRVELFFKKNTNTWRFFTGGETTYKQTRYLAGLTRGVA